MTPVLDGYRHGVHISIWCPHCRRWHHHGVCSGNPACPAMPSGSRACTCPPGSGDGHRVAHCGHDSGSPYYARGYVVREVGHWSDRPRHERRRTANCSGEVKK